MTTKELKEILNGINDDNLIVKHNGSYSDEIKGYYFDTCDNKKYLVLTNLNVQPRVTSEI